MPAPKPTPMPMFSCRKYRPGSLVQRRCGVSQWAETVRNRRVHIIDKNLLRISKQMNEWASKWINEQASEQMSDVERACAASNAELDWALRAIKKADKEMALYSTLWLHSHSTYCEFSSGTTQPLLRVCTSMILTENLNDEVKALGCSIYFLSLHEFRDETLTVTNTSWQNELSSVPVQTVEFTGKEYDR